MASVFISYSHLDEAWKDLLDRHFRVFKQQGLAVEAWHDRRIPGGGDWEAEIQKAMAEADAAILLISADSLGSKFINEREVPFLLGRSKADLLPVVPVVVRPCTWKLVPWLTKLNLRPRDGHPLSAGTEHEIEAQLVAIAEEVFHLAKRRAAPEPEDDLKRSSASRAEWLLAHPYGMPPNFTGRAAERGRLTEWLEKENGPALLVLRALGGFGKSALVWHWLMEDLDPALWQRVVWWSFYDDPSFDAFLGEVLNYLGLDAKTLTVRDGLLLLLDALRRSRILLVLDGFERALRAFAQLDAAYHLDDEEKRLGREEERDCVSPAAEAFLRAVSSLPGLAGRVLLTTRLRPRPVETRAGEILAGCREIELTALSKADAVDFFHAEGIQGTRAEIETVCGHYGFHPLSLRLLAGMIVKDLRNPRDILVAQRLDVSGDLVQRKHHVLDQSYASLPVEGRRLLSRISCLRGAVDYKALCAASGGLAENEVEGQLQDLVERGLLHRDQRAGRFDLHPIVRRYAYDRLGKEEKEEAHRSLRDYFAAVPPIEKVQTLADLAPVIELYHHMVRAGEHEAACDLCYDRLHNAMYYQLGACESLIELLRALFPDGEDRPPRLRKESDQSWTLNTLANSYGLSGQLRRAVPLFEQAAVIDERRDDKNALAIGLGNLATPQVVIGGLRSAEANLRRSIEICREIDDAFWEAVAHREFGRLLGMRGRWEENEAELAAALAGFEKMDHVQSQGIV
ncbi:MAG: toll/interleukin-1 receptor domain-containing protein [Acidobacteriota bacterium]